MKKEDRMKIRRIACVAVLSVFAGIFLAACGGGDDAAPGVPLPVVTTGAATSTWHDNATVNGTVNPNGLATDVWFEYGTDNTLATNTPTAIDNAGIGTAAVAATANLTGLDNNTTYYYRIAASNSAGTVRGTILNFTTPEFDPAPVANAGTDQSVFMLGGDGATDVALDASGSTDVGGSIASYAWTQLSGTVVTLTGGDTATPTFTAPTFTYLAAQDNLVFQVEVTDNDGLTSTDNVTVAVNWGYYDDFTANTTANYTYQSGGGTLTWADNAVNITNGAAGVFYSFSRIFGLTADQRSRSGQLSFVFHPTAVYTGGGIVVSLHESTNVRYLLSTVDDVNYDKIVEKRWAADNAVTAPFTATPSAGNDYTITITYDYDDVTFSAFGETVPLYYEDTGASPSYFTITLVGMDGTFDDFKLELQP
ncbi:MAG: hypothetical protein IH577_00600 [Deltaproteobacteria bacterium]|nr:hypothetical protein [Deltaproteobacteria bacterium]